MADDTLPNITAIRILLQLCKDLGVKIVFDSVVDGVYAVEEFKKRNKTISKNNIQIMILDFHMTTLDGDKTAKIVKFIYQR